MKPRISHLMPVFFLPVVGSCLTDKDFVVPPIENQFSFVNLSTRYYAALEIREHADNQTQAAFASTPLLAPGAGFRAKFRDVLDVACPGSLDLRVFLYRRIHDDLPIGLDEGEAVDPTPLVAGAIEDLPACDVQVLETYTIVNWDAPEGVARIKIAQGSCSSDTQTDCVENAIRDSGSVTGPDLTWEVTGVDPTLVNTPPPTLAESSPITGRVTLADGTGVEGIGVLIRTRFRVRLDDQDADNDPDSGYGDPIAVTRTDESGRFQIDRPAGVYQLELFSDEFAFRPAIMEIETPLEEIQALAEPL
jgi:hypothetical protein